MYFNLRNTSCDDAVLKCNATLMPSGHLVKFKFTKYLPNDITLVRDAR